MSESFFGGIVSAIAHGRDRAVSELARLLANRFALARYGEMREFSLDSDAREFRAEFLLRGEDRPVSVRAAWRLEKEGGATVLTLERVRTSREWMTRLIADRAASQPLRVELSPAAAVAARILGL